MAKVGFTFRDGKTKTIDHRIAQLLAKLGRGSYLTTDLEAVTSRPMRASLPRSALLPERAASAAAPPVSEPEPESKPEGRVKLDTEALESAAVNDDLDGMDAGALRDLAKSLGVHAHHFAGPEKLRSLIREFRESATADKPPKE